MLIEGPRKDLEIVPSLLKFWNDDLMGLWQRVFESENKYFTFPPNSRLRQIYMNNM